MREMIRVSKPKGHIVIFDKNKSLFKRHFIKSSGFQSPRHASCTSGEIETTHALYKRKR